MKSNSEEDELEILENFNYKFRFRNDKIQIIERNDFGDHITIHLGLKSKIFDIHRTTYNKEDRKPIRETVLVVRHFTIGRLLVIIKRELDKLTSELFVNRITVAKMHKNGYIIQNIEDIDPNEIFKITKSNSVITPKVKIKANLIEKYFINPCEIRKLEKLTMFLIHSIKNGRSILKGVVFSKLSRNPSENYLYISKEHIVKICKRYEDRFEEIVKLIFDSKNQDKLKSDLINKITAMNNFETSHNKPV